MPELPEVETTRKGLLPAMKGRCIRSVTLKRRDLRVPIPRDFAKHVTGKTVTGIRRRAKYLLLDLSSKEVVLIHLGMSGSLRTAHPQTYAPRLHDHVLFELDDNHYVVFHDPRRFGVIDLIARGKEKENKWLKHLGPEPLGPGFNATYLSRALERRKGPIKPVLMDQTLVVGVGNIYASESLFLAHLDPRLPARKAAPHAAALVEAIKATLKDALASGGSTLRDYIGADGASGYFQHRFHVYERASKPCLVCKTPITTITQSGRTTYYCSSCQANRRLQQKR